MQNIFSEKKAAQVAAYFLFQARGRLPVLKLMKLMYLVERRSYQQYGEPIIGDTLVSMEHGPVLSRTLNRINGMTPSAEDGWDMWVSDREGYDVALSDASLIRSPEEDLLELSDADLSLLAETWAEFGHLSKYQIRDYTHDHCPEWVDPDGSSVAISINRLFEVLDFNNDQSQTLATRLEEQRVINTAFASAI
ncbi:Panacea domain-containing protein [Glaciimonas soli]|uniref:DUF4065 domain-containing protein n=1 Tax=Glaciimonas soli TaxID=2590999 RepID=A0A843YU08_9BURK|nr:Panacea domain-containing protein [Glaciimonas soli]MQR00988.1 DUF4065 domain-containing protein [Glaciimonas soli]